MPPISGGAGLVECSVSGTALTSTTSATEDEFAMWSSLKSKTEPEVTSQGAAISRRPHPEAKDRPAVSTRSWRPVIRPGSCFYCSAVQDDSNDLVKTQSWKDDPSSYSVSVGFSMGSLRS